MIYDWVYRRNRLSPMIHQQRSAYEARRAIDKEWLWRVFDEALGFYICLNTL
jgi:hypothetical protein